MEFMENQQDLQNNLSAAAHLIHGSSENRFTITYCPGELTQQEIQGVGYQYADLSRVLEQYDVENLSDGWNETAGGDRFYYISNPALGLWAYKNRI